MCACSGPMNGSAVCQYSVSAINAVFEGPFMTQNQNNWVEEDASEVPTPRPGAVSQYTFTSYSRMLLLNNTLKTQEKLQNEQYYLFQETLKAYTDLHFLPPSHIEMGA